MRCGVAGRAVRDGGRIVGVSDVTSLVLRLPHTVRDAGAVAEEVFRALHDYTGERGIYLAVQCCEHLNRAVVLERTAAAGLETVNVIPRPKAGGSLATAAYAALRDPVVVEELRADAGLDIGLTLIGMHLKRVAVPVRLENNRIGEALVVAARTRPRFIGGARAEYDETLL
ncbi:MAG: TIGR01440 family protein [Clostridia bacterium]|nr:TIGR01440 family protein [Clostridia bacterium]